MTRRARSSTRGGFTLPEVLVALLIVSGLMVAALDALRAFDGARVRALGAAHDIEERRMTQQKLVRVVATATIDQLRDETMMRDVVLRAMAGSETSSRPIAPLIVRAIPATSGETAAWVVEAEGRSVMVTPVRVDAPTPCVFDVVARRCRP